VIELYHHTVRAGQYDEAFTLFRDHLAKPIYFQLGAYQLEIDLLCALFPDGEDRPPCLKDESAQAWTLNALANSYSLSGQPRRAVPLFEASNDIDEKRGNKTGVAIGLGNVAYIAQIHIGVLRAAEANLRRRIALCREIKNEFDEAIGHQELGRLLAYRGDYAESETELATGLKIFEKQKHVQSQGIGWAHCALRELFRLRHAEVLQSSIINRQSPIPLARRVLELADEKARTSTPNQREYVRAHWLLGAAYRVAGQPGESERHLHEALERCRHINCVEAEADILIDLARLYFTRADAPHPDSTPSVEAARSDAGASERAASSGRAGMDEAQRLAEEALVITERSGYVLQGADAHLELAKLARARGDNTAALEHAQEARRLAACDGPPDYTYKAAYDEAGALLAELESPREGSGH